MKDPGQAKQKPIIIDWITERELPVLVRMGDAEPSGGTIEISTDEA